MTQIIFSRIRNEWIKKIEYKNSAQQQPDFVFAFVGACNFTLHSLLSQAALMVLFYLEVLHNSAFTYIFFLSIIFLDKAMKGSSTFSKFFTDIKKYETPFWVLHCRISSSLTLCSRSALFPTSII